MILCRVFLLSFIISIFHFLRKNHLQASASCAETACRYFLIACLIQKCYTEKNK